MPNPRTLWITWLLVTAGMAAYLTYRLRGSDRTLFLSGATSHGHYQIELACNECHSPMGGVREQACLDCHGAELTDAHDSHPKTKFTDPRNADRLQALDAARCVTCHREHVPEQTGPMGVTLPDDYCFHCHQETVKERPSHQGLGFDTCATAGCHNYHDNTALYEDFLSRHLDEPDLKSPAVLPLRAHTASPEPRESSVLHPDASADRVRDAALVDAWQTTAHGHAGVNCSACHTAGEEAGQAAWSDRVSHEVCARCHQHEVAGFLAGRHGMRLAQGLTPMSPAQARLPMNPGAAHQSLSCTSCHSAHDFNAQMAAVDACLACHADAHSLAYKNSPHFRLWQAELTGASAPGSGVSCASCHLPRQDSRTDGHPELRVQHNQNLNLRPNEKMLRTVCLSCHGLAFSLDSLADTNLVRANFTGRPAVHVESLDWVRQRRVNVQAVHHQP